MCLLHAGIFHICIQLVTDTGKTNTCTDFYRILKVIPVRQSSRSILKVDSFNLLLSLAPS